MVYLRPFYKTLYFWVLFGIVAGIALGHFAPVQAIAMKPFGDGFIKLIKMVIAPLIFCTIVTGIVGMNSMHAVGRVGLRALLYFEGLSTVALLIGLAVVNIVRPGVGMNVDPATLDADGIAGYTAKAATQGGFTDFMLHVIPDTMAGAFASGEILQVLLVAILFAVALLAAGDKGQPVADLISSLSDLLFRIVGFIVLLAPLGAFGAMAYTIGKYGLGALGPLLHLMLAFYGTCILFVAVVLGGVMRAIGLRLWPLLNYIREELLIVLGTSSSEAALPRLMQKMEAAGCEKGIVGLVVPTGYSFNLDGTSIYLTMAAVFIAQALNIPLDFGHQLLLIGVLLLSSKGAAGVTGSGFVVLAATLSSVGHIPVAGLALILGIDRFMSEARAITNIIGNSVATLVVSRWENALDVEKTRAILQDNRAAHDHTAT